LVIFIAFFAFLACEKVIDIDLADSKSTIVIEATITNNRDPFTVLVSKTSPYFGTATTNLVSGAKVSVRVENGIPKYFKESSPGVYKLEKTTATAKNWYIVDVEYEGVTYSARSYMHDLVPIMDFSLSYFDGFGLFDSGYKVNCFIRDPAGIKNYYRMKIFVNGKLNEDEINIYSDELFDGKVIGLVQHSAVFKETDNILVELQSIDKATYDYFSTLESISGIEMIQSASPANPISNFNNGALGYFSAYSLDRKVLKISDYISK
jgi:hypothetical protein